MNSIHEQRVKRLEELLERSEVKAALIIQPADLYYFTGLVFQGVLVVVPGKGYITGVVKPWSRGEKDIRLEHKMPMRSWRSLPDLFEEFGAELPDTLGMELDVIPYGWVTRFMRYTGSRNVTDISPIMRSIRSVKDPSELSYLEKSAAILRKTFELIPALVTPGMRESQLAVMIEHEMRKLGNEPILRVRRFNLEIYYGAMGTGRSTSAPTMFDGPVGTTGFSPAAPYFAGDDVIREGDTLMVDLMAGYAGYITDATRTYFLGDGTIPEHVVTAHRTALEILENTRKNMIPGANPEELYSRGLKRAQEASLQDNYMGYRENQVKFLGHGVGLEVDELPVLAPRFTEPLKENMVIAVEPKFFFGDYSCGIEDTFVVTLQGGRALIGGELDIIRIS